VFLIGVVLLLQNAPRRIADEYATRPAGLVQRHVDAPAPNRLWVADSTYVRPGMGWFAWRS
jgi:hypothetical protein